MRHRKLATAAITAIALGFCFSVSTRAAEEPVPGSSLADVLPPDTLLLYQAPNPLHQRAGFESSVLGKMADHPEVARFLQDLAARRKAIAEDIAARSKLPPAVVEGAFEGRFAAAILDVEPGADGQMSFCHVIAVRLRQSITDEMLLQAVQAVFQDAGKGSAGGIRLKNVAWKEAPIGPHPVVMVASDKPLRFVLLGQTVLYYRGASRKRLTEIVGNYDNLLAARSLAKTPLYRDAYRGAEAHPGMAFLFVNAGRLYSLLHALQLPRAMELMNALGMTSVRAIGCASGFYHDGTRFHEGMRHTLYLHAPEQREGILRALSAMPERDAEQAAVILPASAPGFLAARVNLAELYAEIPRLVDATEAALQVRTPLGLSQLARKQTLCGVPVSKLLATLGDAIVVEPGPAGTAIRFNNANHDAFLAVMAQIEQGLNAPFLPLPVQAADGSTPVIRYFNRADPPLPLAPSYTVLPKRANGTCVVYAASHPQVLKAIFREQKQGGLNETADHRRVMAGMGSGYGVFAYVDNRASWPRVYNALLPILNVWTAAPFLPADPALLPPGGELAPYVFGSGVGIKNLPEGITFTAYSPLGLGGFVVFLADKLLVSNPASFGILAARAASWFGGETDAPITEPSASAAPESSRRAPPAPARDAGAPAIPGIGQ